jgi:hypothetical protein
MVLKTKIDSVNKTKLEQVSNKYLEEKVIFSFKYTNIHNNYCLSKSKQIKKDIESLYCTLREKEDFTWGTFLR